MIMKKIIALSALALCLGFTACDNYDEPNPPAQSNPQLPIFETDGLKFNPSTAPLDLQTLNAEGLDGLLGDFTVTNLPEGYTVEMVMDFSADNKFTEIIPLETVTTEDSTITIVPQVLSDAYRKAVTKNPSTAKIYGRFAPYAVNGTSKVRIGGPDLFFGPVEYTITPIKPIEIEQSYSLVYSTDGTTWSTANAIAFTHDPSTDVYDDPKFSFIYNFPAELTAAGLFWRVVPESTMKSGDFTNGTFFGTSEEGQYDEEGKLVENSAFAGVIFNEGPVMFNIDIEARTYSFFAAFESFYTPGGANGWSFPSPSLFTTDYKNYSGFVHLNGEFKLNPEAGWNGKDFGCQKQPEFTEKDGIYAGEGVADGGENIKVPAAALYFMTLDYATRKFTLNSIKELGIIGGFNGWGKIEPMTPSADFTTWTITQKMSAGDEWKFRADENWDINLGGNLDNLTVGGDNIKCAAAGTYEITLDLTTYPYSATVVKK